MSTVFMQESGVNTVPRPKCYLAKCVKNGTNWNIDVQGYNLKKITCYENDVLHNVEKLDENNFNN